MDNFKFNFLSRGQLESLSLDKFLLTGFKTITCHEVFLVKFFPLLLECCAEIISIYVSNSLRYWIYKLIITTYYVSKRGFHCALSFCPFCSFPFSILSSPPYYPESLRFFPLFSLVPLTPAGLKLPTFFAYLSLISLSSTPLHYEVQVRIHHHYHRSLLSAWRMGPLILLLQANLSLAATSACLQV